MSVESFFTVQNHLPVKDTQYKPSSDNAANQNDAEERVDGARFLDLILAELDENSQDKTGEKTLLALDDSALDDAPKLDLVALVAANPEIKDDVANFIQSTGLGEDVALAQTLALNQIALEEVLKPLASDALLNEDGLLIEPEEIAPELSSLLNLNLTPAQLAALQRAREARGAGEEIVLPDFVPAEFVIIAPPEQQKTLELSDSQKMAARLNALNVGSDGDQALEEQISKYLGTNFKESLKQVKEIGQQISGNNSGQTNAAAQALSAVSSGGSTATGQQNGALTGGVFTPQDGLQNTLQNTEGELAPLPASPNATQMGNLTSLLAQGQSAARPHPATQALAVNIQKAMGKGGDTTLTLQLDPPELGRVEVRLAFNKDNALKTTIITEKPETFLMLQRDAQMLERAIQDMGVESDGGISFELAEQGFDFEQDNQRGGGHDQGGTGGGHENEGEQALIESTMTWLVDPETGHVHYDIFA